MTKTRPRLFYGWWVVATSALALFLGPIPIVVFSFGVFLKPLIMEFHSGRGSVSLAFTLHNAVIAFGLPFAGRLCRSFWCAESNPAIHVNGGLDSTFSLFLFG